LVEFRRLQWHRLSRRIVRRQRAIKHEEAQRYQDRQTSKPRHTQTPFCVAAARAELQGHRHGPLGDLPPSLTDNAARVRCTERFGGYSLTASRNAWSYGRGSTAAASSNHPRTKINNRTAPLTSRTLDRSAAVMVRR